MSPRTIGETTALFHTTSSSALFAYFISVMTPSKLKILVPLALANLEEGLVRFAASMALTREGEIHLTHILQDGESSDVADSLLRKATEVATAEGATAIPHVIRVPNVTKGIQAAVAQWDCNMMIMGWYRGVDKLSAVASQSRTLAKEVRLETLILKERNMGPAKRILVLSGGGSHALTGIQTGYELSQLWGADMEILRVVRDSHCNPDDLILQRYCEQLRQESNLQLSLLGIDLPTTVLPAADVVSTIADRAGPDDLVILGASNEWRQEEYLAGSIPDEITNKVSCSVLIARSTLSNRPSLSDIFWANTIRLSLRPKNKWEAIETLVDALVEEKQVPSSQHQLVLDTAIKRERETSTAIGHEIAVPHARIPDLPGVIGCLGICPEGVDFEGTYPEAVRFVFLLLTPQQNYRSYIPVLAKIATLMRPNETRKRFLDCQTPTDVTSLIRSHDGDSIQEFACEMASTSPT